MKKSIPFCLVLILGVMPATPLLAQDEATQQLPLSVEEQQQVGLHLERALKDPVYIRSGFERFEDYLHARLQFYGGTIHNLRQWSTDRYRPAQFPSVKVTANSIKWGISKIS